MLDWAALRSSGELPNPESERVSLCLPHWQAGSSPPAPPGKPLISSGWLQRKAENAKNWRKVWDPEGGVWFAFKVRAVVTCLCAEEIKRVGWSVALPWRPQKVLSTLKSGSGQRGKI